MKSILWRNSCMLHTWSIQGCFHNQVRRSKKERKLDVFLCIDMNLTAQKSIWIEISTFCVLHWELICNRICFFKCVVKDALALLSEFTRNQSLIPCLHEKRCIPISLLFIFIFHMPISIHLHILHERWNFIYNLARQNCLGSTL